MKRAVSVFLLAILSVSASLPVFAQKSRSVARTKIAVPDNSTRFLRAEGFSDGSGVWLKWQMESETNNLGFYVYRIDADGKHLISPDLILGSAAQVGDQVLYGGEYNFFDAEGSARSAYVVENLLMNGTRSNSETFVPKQVANLESLSGFSSNEMLGRKKDKSDGTIANDALNLPKAIVSDIESNQIVPDINTHRAVIAQPGVKIGVRNEGLYRVTRTELQAGGFDVNSDSSLWQLYVEGNQQAIIVGANASYIEFYGRGVDTIESDTRLYYLITGSTAGKRIDTRLIRRTGSTVIAPNYSQTAVRKERTNYLSLVLNGDAENYWGRAVIPPPPLPQLTPPYVFTLTGVDFARASVSVDLRFQGFSFVSHVVQVVLNGQTVGSATGLGREPFSASYNIPTSVLREGANSLVMTSGAAGDVSFFDSISISYARKYLADQNRLSSFTQNYRASKLEGFTAQNIRVFDTTLEGLPRLITNLDVQPDGAGFAVNLPPSRGRLIYAVEDSAVLSAVSIAQNDPAMLGIPSNAANLVIISYKNWMTQAEAWANYRRAQGITVKVVDVAEIYDEFNFGVLSSDSIKSFLSYANNNWQTAPQYVLLIGDASFDSRNYQGLGFFNFVPTRLIDTIFTETGSDEYLADFNGDGLAEMAIGRIPARDAQTVTNVLAKVMTWENSLNLPMDRGALFACDVPNGYDFCGMSGRLINQLPTSMPTMLVRRGLALPENEMTIDPNGPTNLITAMNTGKYVVNYAGHGSTGAWVTTTFFGNPRVPELTNANNQSIFTMLTCLNGYFLNVNIANKSLSENLLDATNGGAVAVWSSTGLTTPDIQEIMATRFYNQLGAGNITRMGDLIRDAKTAIPGGTDVRLSWALIGDPMLKVR